MTQASASLANLNLDTLLVEPARIEFADGRTITLRDFTAAEELDLLRDLAAVRNKPDAEQPLAMADYLVKLTAGPADAALVDDLPLAELPELLRWLQTIESLIYTLPARPAGTVTLNGRARAVNTLTVRAYRTAWNVTNSTARDMADAFELNLQLVALMLEDTTLEELKGLRRAQRLALDTFVKEQLEQVTGDLQTRLGNLERQAARS